MHERGIVTRVPGLYFVGLHFLYSMTSATVLGVGRDAERIARAIEARTRVALVRSNRQDESDPAFLVKGEAGLGQSHETELAKKTV